ncbi:hypothetical protein ODJ79_37095 [Actinoplanes sp. KI2]|uniref:hypothetical protein n=1 Tax=Actinoplanes sp. KI2 TaxID=2983315 RepID=UPI0021D5F2D5|nr:hypothetical protein [Actinoplanes sp. KI2]MCU7729365.1 hypothetical protein [Actinoplanes sp. KI2]
MPKTLHLCAAVAAVLALGACGQSATDGGKNTAGGDEKQVASLSSPAPAAHQSAESGGQRPQLRLDTSDAERDRLDNIYDDCLVAHGVKVNTARTNAAGGKRSLDQSGEPKQAYTACLAKLPLQPPELDEDKNPNFAAQWNDNVKCLRAHGLKVHVTQPGEWTYDDDNTPEPPDVDQLQKACILEVFGGHGAAK